MLQTDSSQFFEPIRPIEDLALKVGDLRRMVSSFLSNQSLHKRTGGAHGAMIYDATNTESIIVEDVGRLNAVDKSVGAALQKEYNLSRSVLIVSGRLTSEMVSKSIRAGIPVMGSLAVATDMGIHLAMNNHLTLLGRLKDDNFWLYNQGYVTILS